jgi:hypothetical protein
VAYPDFDLVQRAYTDLKAEGKIQRRSAQPEVEQDKGLLTQRSALYVNQQRDARIGVMEKQDGNHYVAADGQRYSVDWHVRQTDGEGWDVVTDSWDETTQSGEALPVNGSAHGPNPDNIPRWRPPTAANAQIDQTAPPEPEPPPVSDTDTILAAIAASEARIIAASDAGDQRTLDRLNSIVDQAEATLRQILVAILLLRRRRPEEPPPTEDEPSRVLLLKVLQSAHGEETP